MMCRRYFGVTLAGTVAVAMVGIATICARYALVGEQATARPPFAYAERSGLRLGTRALSGRVALVASTPEDHWRIIGVTGWHRAFGRVLTSGWDTTRLDDGPYVLELDRGGTLTMQPLFIRNSTYLHPTLIANASAGLDTRSSDARAVVGAFTRRSYRPGQTALLKLLYRYPTVRVELLHVGPERQLTVGNETMQGVGVAAPVTLRGDRGALRIPIGEDWQSGLYTARLRSGNKLGFAPFIVRPGRLGTSPVAVVEPTNTWQAYNYRDSNGDGRPDTWYYSNRCHTIDLQRPYLDRGVPPHFRQYDLTFLRWLTHTGRRVDMLAQDDIERLSGDRLAKLYRLIIFPGHHEYATQAEYDSVQRYRDLGGHLAFLSANNFFWRVNRHGNLITRIGLWRDLGRPEAALVGVQYFTWNQDRFDLTPYTIRDTASTPWLFAGTGLATGDTFAEFGIEADRVTAASPRSLTVLATIPHIFDARYAAAMTYYETPRGARVFAAGAFTLAGTRARCAPVAQLLSNLWAHLAEEPGNGTYGNPDLGPCPTAQNT